MEMCTIREQLDDWSDEELRNLLAILGEDSRSCDINIIENVIKETYYSNYRENIKKIGEKIIGLVNKDTKPKELEVPSYSLLLEEASRKLKV